MKLTPLEMAKLKAKRNTCKTCSKGECVGTFLYCGVTGKIILPMFEDMEICYGKYLEKGIEYERL